VDLALLSALTDDELIRRHDAIAAEDVGDAAHRSTVYLDELSARVAEQELQEMMRRVLGLLPIIGILVVARSSP
jgi:hypothetical protein